MSFLFSPFHLQVTTAQSVYAQQNGSYANSLDDLYNMGQGSKSLLSVVQSQRNKTTYKDHIFTDLIDDSERDNSRSRYALQATATLDTGKSYLLIMDQNQRGSINENRGSSDNRDIQYYETSKKLPIMKSWPSSEELSQWTLIELTSPQEAMKNIERQKY